MRLPGPLRAGILRQRYKRFLADVELAEGTVVTAHCADPGRLPGLAVPGARVWLSHHDDPRRKLRWTLELIAQGEALVAVNSQNPNRIAREGFESGRFAFAEGWTELVREPRIEDGTRLDFLLARGDRPPLFVEVKGITWRREGLAVFPDAPTLRGRKHLRILARLASEGFGAALLFIAQRGDVSAFAPAADVDPAYAEALAEARAAGVRVEAWRCTVNHNEILLDRQLPLV